MKSQIKEFQESNEYAELSGIDGETIEFEWNVFPGFAKIEILGEIVKDLNARQINPEQFEGLILFMSMFNDNDWTQNGKFITLYCEFQISERLRRKISARALVILRSWKKSCLGRTLINQKENVTIKPIR